MLESPWPAIKIAGEYEPEGQGPSMDLEHRIAYGLMHVPANTESQDRVTLTEFRMIPRDGGWLVMLKGTRGSRRLIAFVHAHSWEEALRTTTTMVDSGHLAWRVDHPRDWSL